MAARDVRRVAEAFQRLTVADRALGRLPVAGSDQRFALGDAFRRYLGDESGFWIAIERVVNLFACVRLGAAGWRLRLALVCQRRRLDLVGHWKRPIGALGPISYNRNKADQQHPRT